MAKQTWVNVGGTWRKVKSAWVKVNGVWKNNVMPKGVVSGGYKEFMQYYEKFVAIMRGRDYSASSDEGLHLFNYDGSKIKTVSNEYMNETPAGNSFIEVDDKGNIYVLSTRYNELIKYDKNGNVIFRFGITNPLYFCISSSGRIAIRYSYGGYSRVQIYNADGSPQKEIGLRMSTSNTRGLCFDESERLYVQVNESRMDRYDRDVNKIWEAVISSSGFGNLDVNGTYVYHAYNGYIRSYYRASGEYRANVSDDNRMPSYEGNFLYVHNNDIYLCTSRRLTSETAGIAKYSSVLGTRRWFKSLWNPKDVRCDIEGNVYVIASTDFTKLDPSNGETIYSVRITNSASPYSVSMAIAPGRIGVFKNNI